MFVQSPVAVRNYYPTKELALRTLFSVQLSKSLKLT